MTHEEEGDAGPLFPNKPVKDINVLGYQGKAFVIGAVPPKPAPTGIVYAGIGRMPVAPEIQSPYLDAFGTEPAGKPFIAKGMFRHTMYELQNGPRLVPARFR
jgi:hypothetical protein